MNIDFNVFELSDIAKLNRVRLENRSQLPSIPAIYFVAQNQGCGEVIKVIYIGKAVNLRNRWITHQKTKVVSLMEEVYIFYLSLAAEFHQKAEWELIKKFKPALNEINPQPNSTKESSAPRTIRFPADVDNAIATMAKERGVSFSALVVEFCGDRLIAKKSSIENRVEKLEQKVANIEARLDA